MIKTVLIGLWACLVTLGAGYFGTIWKSTVSTAAIDKRNFKTVTVKPVSIPHLKDGTVEGDVHLQLSYVADGDELAKHGVRPDAILTDAALKQLYGVVPENAIKEVRTDLAEKLKMATNKFFGTNIVSEVLITEFGFIAAGAARKDHFPPKSKKGNAN